MTRFATASIGVSILSVLLLGGPDFGDDRSLESNSVPVAASVVALEEAVIAAAAAVEVATAAMQAAAPVRQLREAALAMAVESACYLLWGFHSSSSYSPPTTASAAASPPTGSIPP